MSSHVQAGSFSIAIVGLVIAALAIGIALVVEGQSKANLIKDSMREEQVSLAALAFEGADSADLIDSAEEAQRAADLVKEHRHNIAATSSDLMAASATGRYDPTNLKHLSYSQAINLEDYLYVGAASLGLTTVTSVSGVVMTVTGLAPALAGFALARFARKVAVPATA
ncbi:MAG: hypothetical protein QUS33_14430 [Dehalococcoidia bacterium]|nr:hypothetical protein [Dehalococcoidia bacterium]